jgi:hypothetical protein
VCGSRATRSGSHQSLAGEDGRSKTPFRRRRCGRPGIGGGADGPAARGLSDIGGGATIARRDVNADSKGGGVTRTWKVITVVIVLLVLTAAVGGLVAALGSTSVETVTVPT